MPALGTETLRTLASAMESPELGCMNAGPSLESYRQPTRFPRASSTRSTFAMTYADVFVAPGSRSPTASGASHRPTSPDVGAAAVKKVSETLNQTLSKERRTPRFALVRRTPRRQLAIPRIDRAIPARWRYLPRDVEDLEQGNTCSAAPRGLIRVVELHVQVRSVDVWRAVALIHPTYRGTAALSRRCPGPQRVDVRYRLRCSNRGGRNRE